MSVTRKFVADAPAKDNGKYYGLTPRNHRFQTELRSISSAVERRKAYNALRLEPGFDDLATATNDAMVQSGMEAWEKAHPDQCALSEDDGQFFGFANVGRGLLQRYVSFVFVPAVRDASSDAADKSGTVAHQLIELLVKTVVEQRDDFKKWKAEAEETYAKLVDPENLGELTELSESLTGTLTSYYEETSIDLQWKPAGEFQASLPAADILLTEKGYKGPVEGKGHGLQRAFVFTLLQHLARALHTTDAQVSEATDIEPIEIDEGSHTLILAIEEPELYQHPTKQRHFAKVLAQLAGGGLAGVIDSNQVIICSHSPLFVSMDRFSDIRIVRRANNEGRNLVVNAVSEQEVCEYINNNLHLEGAAEFQPDLLATRLHILDPLVAEGFFASTAVVVEGPGDKAALTAAAYANGIDLEGKGIAILPVHGKTNIAKPLAVFKLFGIPTYAIFDSDQDLKQDNQRPEVNMGIQRMQYEQDPQEFRTYVGAAFGSFKDNLEKTLKSDLGETLDKELEKASYKYGLNAKRLMKNPIALGEILSNCYKAGAKCKTLDLIVSNIASLNGGENAKV